MNKGTAEYKEYFDRFSSLWLKSAYDQTAYDYPVGFHRMRILRKAIEKYNLEGKKVLDIGCGGGDISFLLASKGARVIGIDMSDTMLATAEKRKAEQQETIQGKISFRYENFTELSDEIKKEKFDFIIAFGLIGYLESDRCFFNIVKTLSKKSTVLLVSCRNELFNVTSISDYTVKEVKEGNICNLIKEIDEYYIHEISEENTHLFLDNMSKALEKIKSIDEKGNIDEKGTPILEMTKDHPRQSTPRQMKNLAEEFGFELVKYYGVHPHLLLPRFNRKLPPRIFNILSDALCAFEEEDISLIWSSVFIGEFILH